MSSDFSTPMSVETSMNFETRDLVGIPCEIALGAFPHERWIQIETEEGPFIGLVEKEGNLQTSDDKQGLVMGIVINSSAESVTVKLFGSFVRSALGFVSVDPKKLVRLAPQ
jgi:hypothetical protein